MNKYASMLMLSPDLKHVVLLEKNRPSFLAGKLCPTGGREEDGETPAQAAAREHEEEAGVKTQEDDWVLYAVSNTPESVMNCFCCVSSDYVHAKTMTDEPVTIMLISDVLRLAIESPERVAPDLIALIGLALQSQVRESTVTIDYSTEKPRKKCQPA